MALTPPNLISRFAEIGIHDRSTVGGKGASLGELARAGIRVPPGCVVTTAAFERFLACVDPRGAIRGQIERLAADDLAACKSVGTEVRARLESKTLPQDLQAEIANHYQELHPHAASSGNSEPVAIRSSATSEDSADAS